jgi:hypothetical protein
MPKHGLHAVFGIFEVDPIVNQVSPDLGWIFITIEVFEQRKWQQELLLGLKDQVDAVGIKHLSVTLEHIHHLNQVVWGFVEQGLAAEQLLFKFCSSRPASSVD